MAKTRQYTMRCAACGLSPVAFDSKNLWMQGFVHCRLCHPHCEAFSVPMWNRNQFKARQARIREIKAVLMAKPRIEVLSQSHQIVAADLESEAVEIYVAEMSRMEAEAVRVLSDMPEQEKSTEVGA